MPRIADRVLTALILAAVLAFASWMCKSSSTPSVPDQVKENPSFASDIQPVFTNSCSTSGCHGGTGQVGLVLSAGQSYALLVNVDSTQEPPMKRVVPSDAVNSYLVIKLENRQTVGSRMPPSGALSATSLQNIKNWINKGANNN
jgi:hypothetical protein